MGTVPLGNTKKYVIIHQGSQVTTLNTYKQSVDFINNQLKTQKRKPRSSNVRKSEKRRDALGLFYESVLTRPQLRQCAHNQECYHELMEWRSEIIEYLDGRRNQEFG